MDSLLKQIKKRRIALALKQHDMMMRVGMSRQQYQRLESKGNPRLNTIELIAEGLSSELLLIPQEKLNAVLAILDDETSSPAGAATGATIKPSQTGKEHDRSLADDPWQGLLGETE